MGKHSNLVFYQPNRVSPFGQPLRVSLAELLERIDLACEWLAGKGLSILSFSGSTLDTPIIVVAAHPRVYAALSGRYERTGFCQDGALRYETWEAFDVVNRVRVRWQEVKACAS